MAQAWLSSRPWERPETQRFPDRWFLKLRPPDYCFTAATGYPRPEAGEDRLVPIQPSVQYRDGPVTARGTMGSETHRAAHPTGRPEELPEATDNPNRKALTDEETKEGPEDGSDQNNSESLHTSSRSPCCNPMK